MEKLSTSEQTPEPVRVKPIQERFLEWRKRCNEIAQELDIEVEVTTESIGSPYLSYEAPCFEVCSTDTYETFRHSGGIEFGVNDSVACIRADGHAGACNGYARVACLPKGDPS